MNSSCTIHVLGTRLIAFGMLAVCLIPTTGCTICANCEDLAYPAYGGAWQRTLRDEGRVGSLFDPAGAKVSDLVARDKPEGPDEIERAKQEARDDADPESRSDERPKQDDDADDADDERDFEDKANQLRDLDLEDINLVPGQPVPPSLQ